jgi:hypothetical protein
MTTFATGKKSWAISDRSGQRFPYVEMVTEWNGLFVHYTEYEPKHPQLEPKVPGNDPQGLLNARPDRVEPAVIVQLPYNPLYATVGSSTVLVNDPGHGNKIGSSIRVYNPTAGNGYSIDTLSTTVGYVVTSVSSDSYSINLPTTATGTGFFGGGYISIGPSAVELGENPFLVSSNSSTIIVSDANHGRITGNNVLFQGVNALNNFNSASGFQSSVLATVYTITVLNVNTYSFNAYSGVGLSNMVIGGGIVTAQTV